MIRINADDFGYSMEDNFCISECLKSNYIDTASIMVNAPCFREAVEIAKQNNLTSRIGLHLNLTEFHPTTELIKSNPRYTANGEFFINKKNRSVIPLSKRNCVCLSSEIEHQMEIFRNEFPDSPFLDSHHHIHTVPSILKIVLKLAKKYNFRVVRISKNVGVKNPFKYCIKAIINRKIIKKFPESSSYFCYPNKTDILNMSKKKRTNCEIMVHPHFEKSEVVDKYSTMLIKDIRRLVDEY